LEALEARGGMTAGQIAGKTMLSSERVTGALTSLVAARVVVTEPDENGRERFYLNHELTSIMASAMR
jgi:DNA-binding MarR family transcriptional regulator